MVRGIGRPRRRFLLFLGALAALCLTAGTARSEPYPGVPDPGGDRNAIVSVPAPGRFFGYHEPSLELGTHGWTNSEFAAVAAGGGANLARVTLDWWDVEPTRDSWHEAGWSHYQRIYDALVARGIRPLFTLASTPGWAREPQYAACGHGLGCEYPPAPWMMDQWAEFTAAVARRFPQTAAIEIWNEPNLRAFWKPSPNPWLFARMVASAYPSIKAVHPAIDVLAGGFAPSQTPEYDLLGQLSNMSIRQFLATAYPAGLKDRTDGVSFHTVFQELDYGAGSLYAKVFADARSVTSQNGDAGIPLWITETGLTTHGSIGYSEAQQATGLIEQYKRLMTMPDVKAMVVHTLAEQVQLPSSDFNVGYGVIRSFSPFVPKQAFCAFAGRVDTATPFGGCPRVIEESPEPDDGSGGGDPGGGTGGDPGGSPEPEPNRDLLSWLLGRLGL